MEAYKVYSAINKVQAGLAKEGISKDRQNQTQHYSFRGIDDVYNAISGLLAENQLCILPRMLSREMTERKSNNGGALFTVVVDAEFDFVSAEDGSRHTVKTFGEAMDSADKATNKAMSAAYKYACIQAFAIPTEGDNDADATTHNVQPSGKPAAPPQPKQSAPAAPVEHEQKPIHEKLWNTLFDYFDRDEESTRTALFNLTSYTGKSGAHVQGQRSVKLISENVAKFAYEKFQKEYVNNNEPGSRG